MPLGDNVLGDTPFGASGMIVKLKNGASPGKYGFVRVKNGDGSVNREYRITGTQVAAWHAAMRWSAETHIGITQQEWESGLTCMEGWDHDTGDITLEPGGSVVFKYGESNVGGRIISLGAQIEAGDWTGTFPDINVSATKLSVIPGSPFVSLIDGVLETK